MQHMVFGANAGKFVRIRACAIRTRDRCFKIGASIILAGTFSVGSQPVLADSGEQFITNPFRTAQSRPKLEPALAGSIVLAASSEEPLAIATPQTANAVSKAPEPKPLSPNAITWYEQALRLDGNGEEADKEAASLYRLAAGAGHPAAARNLGGMLGEGRGVDQDRAEAAKWFRVAAEGGDAQGQYGLAVWFLGDSVKEIQERIFWLRAAAAQGHERAIATLEQMKVPLVDPKAATTSVVAAADPEPEPAPVAEADPKAAEKCIQAGLNAAGYPVGPVDGIIGRGTNAAFERFRAKALPQLVDYPFRDVTYKNWCLAITAKHPLSGAERIYQAQFEQAAKVYVNIKVPREAEYFVLFRKGEEEIKRARGQVWTESGGFGALFQTVLDYGEVKSADNLCVVFEQGWVVLDEAGNAYQASCDARTPAMMTNAGQVTRFVLEKR